MENKFYQIKVSVVPVSWNDCLTGDLFQSGKTFFRKDQFTGKFIGMYHLPDDSPIWMKDEINQAIKAYQRDELKLLLQKQLLFKVSENPHDFEQSFMCYIKTPSIDDFMQTPNYLKENLIYWVMNVGQVTGPFYTKKDDDPERYIKMWQNGNLMVLSRKQLFEPCKKIAS